MDMKTTFAPPIPAPSQTIILVVEDSPPMRLALCDMLQISNEPCLILQAGNAEEALELVLEQAPDLVLMDIALPGMDGLTCLAEIKRRWPATRSLVISYHEEDPYRQKALQAGADEYITKRRLYLDLAPTLAGLLHSRVNN
jgi:DNA-binding NarL/FixJ family response regulator